MDDVEKIKEIMSKPINPKATYLYWFPLKRIKPIINTEKNCKK